MNVLGIVGSKRKTGNTMTLMQETLKVFKQNNIDTNLIQISDYNFSGCTGCEGCKGSFTCIIKDDMQQIYEAINRCDVLILGSPTYFYNVSADMKKLIDRFYAYNIFDPNDRSVWTSKFHIEGMKLGATISISEQNSYEDMGFTPKALELSLKAIGVRVIQNLKVLHLFDQDAAKQHKQAMQDAKALGETLLKNIKINKKNL
ncbi:MAG: flavodoxin family protein [Candidatus Izimaplasma sp.]|nr:flavodoxin family protein [Candidatus Izimaplasma bacterium]